MNVTDLTSTETSDLLIQSINKNKSFLRNFSKKLDKISSDIKQLEEVIGDSGICIPFHFILSSRSRVYTETEETFNKVQTLSWLKAENGSFRLMYGEGRTEVRAKGNPQYIADDSVYAENIIHLDEQIPFIETKAEIRYRFGNSLHSVLPEIVKHFDLDPDAELPF